jgi:hypothetical protein
MEKKTPVSVKIRYGRESSSRGNIYTMILSNHPETKFGQGFIFSFKEPITGFEVLKKQALELAKAEGMQSTLTCSWGSVGLFVNPKIDNKNIPEVECIKTQWAELYKKYTGVKVSVYKDSVINDDGFLEPGLLYWNGEVDTYDFLIATPTVPSTEKPIAASEIASKIIASKINLEESYFCNNIKNGISTFQDDEIIKQIHERK